MLNVDKWNSQLRKGVLEFCILAILDRQSSYGYQIIRALADVTGVAIKRGTIYAVFKRLHQGGYILYEWKESDSGPPRKIYDLSPEGRSALKAMKNHWESFRSSIENILQKGIHP